MKEGKTKGCGVDIEVPTGPGMYKIALKKALFTRADAGEKNSGVELRGAARRRVSRRRRCGPVRRK